MGSSLLFVMLTVFLSSLGTLVQPSHSRDISDSVQMTRSTGSYLNVPHNLSSEVIFHSEDSSDSSEGSGQSVESTASQKLNTQTVFPKEPEQAGNEKDQRADRTNASITGHIHSSVRISEKALTHVTTEEQLKDSHISIVHDDFLDGLSPGVESPKHPVQNNAFTSMTNQNRSTPGGPCVLGLSPCVLPNFNGTHLLWDDMRRTLAFAWELHVFGSSSLFILMAVLAVIGMAGSRTLPYPISAALTLANSLLILSGTLRCVLLLLDPYGTRLILSRATLTALHNLPLQLLLWTQVTLTLVTLRGLNVLPFPLKLQHPWVVRGLAISHCTPLIVADLFSSTLSLSVPLLLQTLSLCWGLTFCMGSLPKSCSHLHPFRRSSVPQWSPSRGIEKRAKRVTAICALLGVLCCTLQMYTLLWLYGLLGHWKHFGWGWWLSQFWARLLELAWSFSLLVLGSWLFWMPSRPNARGEQGQSRSEVSKEGQERSVCARVLASIWKGPLRKSDQTWEDLMPSNWAMYNLSRSGFNHNVMCPYDDRPSAITPEYKPDPVNSSSDAQPALLWQKVDERECILSLIEFDMRPPSPINLRRSIDEALHHGQLVAGGLFASPPPSWTQSIGADTTDGGGGTTIFPPPYVGYRWTLDSDSISAPLDHFQAEEPPQLPSATSDYNGGDRSPATAHHGEEFNSMFSAVMHRHNWLDDDVTDL